MRALGLILLTVGFLGGAFTGSISQESVDWTYFVPALLLGAVGVALAQIASRRRATHKEVLEANVRDIDASITRIAENIRKLDEGKADTDVYDVPPQIDELFPEDINRFVDARETIAHVYGLEAYADVMGVFAAGERYLNRVWSAGAEGYIDEVHTYLARAREQFLAAHEKIQALMAAQEKTGS